MVFVDSNNNLKSFTRKNYIYLGNLTNQPVI